MALCRRCHDSYGDIGNFKEDLRVIHQRRIDNRP
jgi:hypothetical protein